KRPKLYTGSRDAEGDDRLLDPATDAAHVRAMYTRPDWTRRGLGRRILEACESAARADGFRMLTLGATLPGLPLYQAFGFQEIGREDVVCPTARRCPAPGWRRQSLRHIDGPSKIRLTRSGEEHGP